MSISTFFGAMMISEPAAPPAMISTSFTNASQQHPHVPALQHEAAEDAQEDRDGADDDDHARAAVVARRDRPDSKRWR